jgi:hypothetical protein
MPGDSFASCWLLLIPSAEIKKLFVQMRFFARRFAQKETEKKKGNLSPPQAKRRVEWAPSISRKKSNDEGRCTFESVWGVGVA